MSDALAAAVRAAFPARSVESIAAQDARPGNRTGRVTFTDGSVVYVKTTTDGHTERLARDAAATQYVGAHADLAVAEVVRADPAGDPPYLATAPLGTEPLADTWVDADPGTRAELLRDVGTALARLHELRFDQPGRIVGGDAAGLELDAAPWSETLCATVAERVDTLFAERFTDLPPRLDDLLADAAPVLDDARTALLHGDLNRSNCRRDPAGFLDWERALVGDPGFDVADAAAHLVDQPDTDEAHRDRLRAALHDGYRDHAGDLPEGFERRQPVYRAFAFLLTPQTFAEWAPRVDEPTEELAAWVRDEFDDLLEDARRAVE